MKRPTKVECRFCDIMVSKRFLQEHWLSCPKAPALSNGEHICSLCQAIKNLENDFQDSPSNLTGKSHACKTCTTLSHNHWRRLKNDAKQRIEIEGRPPRKDGSPARIWKYRPCPMCGDKYNFRAMTAHILVCDGTKNQPRRPEDPLKPDMEKLLNDELVKNRNLEIRARQLWRTYGITLAEYERFFAKQEGKCAICGGPPRSVRNNPRATFCVDHEHSTGKVRGLLCNQCNHGIGQFRESPDIIASAIEYIEHWKKIHDMQPVSNP